MIHTTGERNFQLPELHSPSGYGAQVHMRQVIEDPLFTTIYFLKSTPNVLRLLIYLRDAASHGTLNQVDWDSIRSQFSS